MNQLDQRSKTRRFSRHKFQKFYCKKSLRCRIFKANRQSSLQLNTQIYRPLIQFSRFEFLKFCEFWYLPILPDLTNLNVNFHRNRLRLQSLPYLKFFFNLHLFPKIDSIQKIIHFENEYFQLIIQKLLRTSLKNFQYSEKKNLLLSITLKYRNQLVNSINKISKLKPVSFRADQNCYSFIHQNLRTSHWHRFPMPTFRPTWVQQNNTAKGRPAFRPLALTYQQALVRPNSVWISPYLLYKRLPSLSFFGQVQQPIGEGKISMWPKSQSDEKYNFLYFPKIFQYRILHQFYRFSQKKISFNEISCIFQRFTGFKNPVKKSNLKSTKRVL